MRALLPWLLSLAVLIPLPALGQAVQFNPAIDNPLRQGQMLRLAIGGASGVIGGLTAGARVVDIVCSVACHIAQASTPATATTSSFLLPANTVRRLRVGGTQDSIAVIRNATDGFVYVVEME